MLHNFRTAGSQEKSLLETGIEPGTLKSRVDSANHYLRLNYFINPIGWLSEKDTGCDVDASRIVSGSYTKLFVDNHTQITIM